MKQMTIRGRIAERALPALPYAEYMVLPALGSPPFWGFGSR